MQWTLFGPQQVIYLRHPGNECLVKVKIALVVGDILMLASDIVRHLHIPVEKFVTSYPNIARISLGVEGSFLESNKCTITMGLAHTHKLLRIRHQVKELQKRSTGTLVLKQRDTTHFIVDVNHRKLSWKHVNSYCRTEFNASMLFYKSMDDLSQISNHLRKEPFVVYTSFMFEGNVCFTK